MSETYGVKVFSAIMNGLDFMSYGNGTECHSSILMSLDQGQMFSANITEVGEDPFLQIEPYLNISNMISTSIRDIALYCPITFTYYGEHLMSHFT